MTVPLTGIPIVDWLLGLLAEYGYLIVFAASTLENVFVVGSFTPGETIIVATAFVAANGQLPASPARAALAVFLLAVVGGILGNNISYFLGLRGGRDALDRYGHRFHVSPKRIAAAEGYFDRHGTKTVFVARFAAGVKNFVPMIAGISKMRFALFEGYTFAGQLVYCAVLVAVGYVFGENFRAALDFLEGMGYGALGVLILLVALVVWAERRRSRRKMEELAEEAERGVTAGTRSEDAQE